MTPVYLPDNRIIFDSTSTFEGVPCVGGSDYVANLHLMNPDGTNIRRLCFDQDNDWYPVVMPSGRVMYLQMGIHRFGALFRPSADVHEPGRHQPGIGLPQQFLLAQRTLVCAPAAGQPDEVRRDHLRAPRRAADGRDGAVRRGQRTAGGHGRAAAHPGLRQAGQGDHQGHPGGRFVAEVPASVSAERQILPGVLQADAGDRPGGFTWWTCSTTCCC